MNRKKGGKATAAVRRRDPDEKAAFRDAVVAVARELFLADGYDAVSFRALASRVGCTPMALYGYFPSKLALLRYIWADIFREVFTETEQALKRATTPSRKIRAYCLAWTAYWLRHPENYRVVFLNQDIGTDEPRSDIPGSEQAFFADGELASAHMQLLVETIEAGIRKGQLRRVDPALAVQLIFSQLLGLVHGLITIPEFRWSEKLPAFAIDVVLEGLRPH